MGYIGPRMAERYKALIVTFDFFVAAVLLVALMCYCNGSDINDYDPFVLFALAVITVVVFIVRQCVSRFFKQELHALRYWRGLKPPNNARFPLTAEARATLRPWARRALNTHTVEAMEDFLQEMEHEGRMSILKQQEATEFIPDAERQRLEIKRIEDRLEKSRIKSKQTNDAYEECRDFLFSEWPYGSPILRDDGTRATHPEYAPEEPAPYEVPA